ncbi:MAG: butyrate kinase [Bacteroidales bacterium]
MILVINPGSTSTKIALFEQDKEVFIQTLRHSPQELAPYTRIADQFSFRKKLVLDSLREAGYPLDQISMIMARGGLIKPIKSGIYRVNQRMIEDLTNPSGAEHASNLGALIANDIATSLKGCIACIADPIVVDELQDLARISGHPLITRLSVFHPLNQKAVARAYAADCGKSYESLRLIVVHMGGGISVGAHREGLVVDVNNALSGDGPFSPERSGTLPARQLAELCFSGKYSFDEVEKMICGKGGYMAYLGTQDAGAIEKRALAGDKQALLIRNAMGYQIAKEIGAMAAVLEGKVDAILLTGGIAYNKRFMAYITGFIGFIAPVHIYPGEDEMSALAASAVRILKGIEKPKTYL